MTSSFFYFLFFSFLHHESLHVNSLRYTRQNRCVVLLSSPLLTIPLPLSFAPVDTCLGDNSVSKEELRTMLLTLVTPATTYLMTDTDSESSSSLSSFNKSTKKDTAKAGQEVRKPGLMTELSRAKSSSPQEESEAVDALVDQIFKNCDTSRDERSVRINVTQAQHFYWRHWLESIHVTFLFFLLFSFFFFFFFFLLNYSNTYTHIYLHGIKFGVWLQFAIRGVQSVY